MTPWTSAQAQEAMARAPIVALDELCAPGAVLVVAPHPDDESLGCGGLIALAAQAGRTAVAAVLTDGDASHPGSHRFPRHKLAALRKAEVREATNRLGSSVRLACLHARDGHLRMQEAQAAAWLTGLCRTHGVATVFAPWAADPHPDHKAASRVAFTAAQACGARLLAYPIWGLTLPAEAPVGAEWPCLRLDVTDVLDRKANAIAAHRSQTTALIDDDPQGFRLTPEDLARHLQPFEPYLWIR